MSDVVSIIDGLDLVISLADGHIHPEDLDAARRSAMGARQRVGHLGSTLVAALFGGTGVGKSSLLNAIAGEPVASTGAIRPHTAEPLAWIPEDAEPSLKRMLSEMGVTHRVEQDRMAGIAILDMTDIDSVEQDNRRRAEKALPMVDVGIWVFDPLKYSDSSTHQDLIRPLAAASDRMIFVVNRVDLVSDKVRARMRSHLEELLAADKVERPIVFETAADPTNGPPVGIEDLRNHLLTRLDHKRVHLGRVVEEAREAARRVAGATGVASGGSVGFEETWEAVCRSAVASLSKAGPTVAVVEEVLRAVERLVAETSARAGGAFGMRIRHQFNADRLEEGVRKAIAVSRIGADSASSRPLAETDRADAARIVEEELQERIGAPMRRLLWERASLAAVMAGLAVETSAVEADLGIRV